MSHEVNLKDLHNSFFDVANAVFNERIRQQRKWGEQNHTPERWQGILMEEVGEQAKESNEYHLAGDESALMRYRNELIQVAAVAIQMIECLDRGKWKSDG